MGNAQDRPEDPRAQLIQEHVEEVLPEEEDFQEISRLLHERASRKHLRHYKYTMRVRRVFRIRPSGLLQSYQEEAEKQDLGKPHLLFHGTTPANAESILIEGFDIPPRPGMFGRGIYFAKDPLKSIRYAQQGSRGSGLSRKASGDLSPPSPGSWLGNLLQAAFGREQPDSVRHMLACEVYLGRSRTLRAPRPNFDPVRELSWPWPLAQAAGLSGLKSKLPRPPSQKSYYHSVRAPGGVLGAVRVTEYVVYSRYQAIPRYLIEFEKVNVLLPIPP